MKKFFKWLGISLGVVLLLAGGLVYHEYNYRPFFLPVFFERVFLKFGLKNPEMLSSMRMLEQIGIRGHNARLGDRSPASTESQYQDLADNLELLRSYDREPLEGQVALSYDVLEWFLQLQADGRRFMWHGYPVNQMFGVQSGLPDFMATTHHLGDERDARDYISRLAQFGTAFEQVLEDLRLRESKEIIPPRITVEKVLTEIRGFRGAPARENILYTSFAEKVGEIETIATGVREELLADVEYEIDATVYPAYDSLIRYLEGLLTKATTNHGAWKLPDGAAYYDYQLRSHTSTTLDANQIHALGLEEVDRIQAEMDAILVAEGLADGSVAERMSALNDDPQFLYPDTDAGREALLQGYRDIITEIDAAMEQWFVSLPKSSVEVKRVPEFRELGSAGAYYSGPSMDGSRPGRFYANLRDMKGHPKFGMRTLAYHEAVPGHHFQTSLQMELTGVPMFRRMLPFTAFSEGWALYAERLAWEAGFQKDPYDNLGRLQAELFRAVRLVVDTGLHRERWTREAAIEYMLDNTGMVESDVVAEIERYLVIPGQATAYKVGMLKILELRDRARSELGDAFDIREFHEAVLRNGDLPLELVEREVDAYIAA